jgi:hypothetical protein
MSLGDEWGWGSAKDEARKVYDAFREAGGNFIDTANFYTHGTSESFLGEFTKDHRQSVVMATKYSNAEPGTDPNAAGKHRKSMMQAVVGPDGQGHEPWVDSVVAIVAWNSDRQIPRSRLVRARPHEQRTC